MPTYLDIPLPTSINYSKLDCITAVHVTAAYHWHKHSPTLADDRFKFGLLCGFYWKI